MPGLKEARKSYRYKRRPYRSRRKPAPASAEGFGFKKTSTQVTPQGKFEPVYEICCSHCDLIGTITLPVATDSSRMPDARAADAFSEAGWRIGETRDRDLCCSCANIAAVEPPRSSEVVAAERMERMKKANEKVLERAKESPNETQTEIPLIQPPREPSRQQNRMILRKLDDCCVGGDVIYIDDYSDAKVAEELGLPVGWITALRIEYYGDDETNEQQREVDIKIVRLRDEVAEQTKALQSGLAALERVRAEIDALTKQVALTAESKK